MDFPLRSWLPFSRRSRTIPLRVEVYDWTALARERSGGLFGPTTLMESLMAWYVYLIECTDGSIYTGIAVDVVARYAVHASGKGSRYMRAHPPARLLATFEYADRSAASIAEHRIKQLSAREKRELCLSPHTVTERAES